MSEVTENDLERIVQEKYGNDHFLVAVSEDEAVYTRNFPPGTRSWRVEHESSTCTHTPCCHWFGRVYWYQGHFTLIKDMEMPFISLRELIDRVSGAALN